MGWRVQEGEGGRPERSGPLCRQLAGCAVSEARIWARLRVPPRFPQQGHSDLGPPTRAVSVGSCNVSAPLGAEAFMLSRTSWTRRSTLVGGGIAFQVGSLGNQTPLFVPQTGIASEQQAGGGRTRRPRPTRVCLVLCGGCGSERGTQSNDVPSQQGVITENQPLPYRVP